MQEFDWSDGKAESNLRKHRIAFEDAIRVFRGPVIEWDSQRGREDRKVAIGQIGDHIFAVVYTWRGGVRWIISARPAKRKERRLYERHLE